MDQEYVSCKFDPENSDFSLVIESNGTLVSTKRQAGYEWLWKRKK